MKMTTLMDQAASIDASDIHITVGLPPMVRVSGELRPMCKQGILPDMSRALAKEIMSPEQWDTLCTVGECDFSISSPGKYRFRVNAYHQRHSIAMALRLIKIQPPDINELGLPPAINKLCEHNRGLILVTGPTGSGKSTTLASMIDRINKTRNRHILTLEDPIEYLHRHKKSIVNQREIGVDTNDYSVALRAALRQDPDIILVGEMRDLETISIAVTAAETGHLVLSTLHTTGAVKTIDRIIDVFPPHQQQQIRLQLSMTLVAIVSQQLLISTDKKNRVVAVETLIANSAMRNLIRENKAHQITSAMQSAKAAGNQMMDDALAELFHAGRITRENAVAYAIDKNFIQTLL